MTKTKKKKYRLGKIVKEFAEAGINITNEKIYKTLKEKGYQVTSANPMSSVEEEAYLFLKEKFNYPKKRTLFTEVEEEKESETTSEQIQEETLDLEEEVLTDLMRVLEDMETEEKEAKKDTRESTDNKVREEAPEISEDNEKEKESLEEELPIKILGKVDPSKLKPKPRKKKSKQTKKETSRKKTIEEKTPSSEKSVKKEIEELSKEKTPELPEKPKDPEVEIAEKSEKSEPKQEPASQIEEIKDKEISQEKNEPEEKTEKKEELASTPEVKLNVVGKIDLASINKKDKRKERAKDKQARKEAQKEEKKKQEKKKRKRRREFVERHPYKTTEKKKAQEKSEKKKTEKNKKQQQNRQQHHRHQQPVSKKTAKQRQKLRRERKQEKHKKQLAMQQQQAGDSGKVQVTEFITLAEFALLLGVPVNEIIMKCMELGYMVGINHRLEKDLMEILADEYGKEIEFLSVEEAISSTDEEEEVDESKLKPRPPIVTIMGHVDHGKTSLLDYIRNTNVVAGEAGGITQSIGAYSVELPDGQRITFIDTPGHEDFSNMRARGARVTDVVIIVVAADDEVKQQTEEALAHAKNAGVPIVFAINKIDKPEVTEEKINKIKTQLAEKGFLVEDWGGDYQSQEISAKTGQGIDELLEKVLVEAELLELKANPEASAKGTVLEASMVHGKGNVANIIVQDGTLREGDPIIAGAYHGKVRAMFDERGHRVKEAGPSTPVQILGLKGIPEAGDSFRVTKSEKEAKEIAQKRQQLLREQQLRRAKAYSLQAVSDQAKESGAAKLNVIIKADNRGSLEAITQSLAKLATEEVTINIVMASVGPISESDVNLAYTAQAIILGFNARPNPRTRALAEERGVEIRNYNIIYKLIEDIKLSLEGMLKPTIEEKILGVAEVRQTFRVPKVGTVAGCMVIDGTIQRNAKVRVVRNGTDIYEGEILDLKRFKESVKEVSKGYECGISIKDFNDIKVGDLIEAFELVEIKRSIDEVKKLYDL